MSAAASPGLQWAYAALRDQLPLCLPGRTAVVRAAAPAARPNLLLAPARGPQPARALLLLRRPQGLAGVPVCDARPPLRTTLLPPPRGRRARRLFRHLCECGARAGGEDGFGQPPLVVHANHVLAWELGAARAQGLYAHTLDELARLRPPSLARLEADALLVAPAYCEWDHYREAAREPGWAPYAASDTALADILAGSMSVADIARAADELYVS